MHGYVGAAAMKQEALVYTLQFLHGPAAAAWWGVMDLLGGGVRPPRNGRGGAREDLRGGAAA